MSRVRSPNYPAISLSTAVEKVRAIHKNDGKNSIAREVLAKHIGYGGLNGGSATMLSALNKYGLLEPTKDGEARVSDLAIRIIFAENADVKRSVLEEAAFKPTIFAKIREKWPDRPPSDESLRSYLGHEGFTETALDQVIQFYREIIDIALVPSPGQHASVAKEAQEPHMQETPSTNPTGGTPPTPYSGEPAFAAKAAEVSKPFNVAFDGAVLTGSINIRSVREIDRLMKVLQAQKAAFEAMLEDEDGS